ncbi:hypothetical protein ACFXAF_36040 [Kitasatospora sp. NPDC059463]
MRAGGGVVKIRESDDPATVLFADPAAFAGLLASIKAGELDDRV